MHKIALAKNRQAAVMAKKRILVAELGKIGKLPPPEGRGSSKNDGRWGGFTDNVSSQYISLHTGGKGSQTHTL